LQKYIFCQYCAKKQAIPLRLVTANVLEAFIDSEISTLASKATGPFKSANNAYDVKILKEALARLSINFGGAADLYQIALETFGASRSLARYMMADRQPMPALDIHRALEAMHDVFSERSYWKRLWVIQELLHAKEASILCGEREMDFVMTVLLKVLYDCSDRTGASSILGNDRHNPLVQLLRLADQLTLFWFDKRRQTENRTLASNLEVWKNRSFSEPRDAIYALLGITQDTDIIIDYSRPIEDIFADATTSIIKQEQNLNILCMQTNLFAPNQENRLPRCELPSWVPHFECGVDLRELNTFHFASDSQRYEGGGPLKALPNRIQVQNT
jgi:hypothetical protein